MKTKKTKPTVRFPNARARLSTVDGNAFALLAAVKRALRTAGATEDEQREFVNEATSGDYHHLIQTCMRWVVVS